ncbi:MAG: RtcB family protein [Actinomycetia bacterium]|nr:RtcB family protein [Actinomycetes bacterium]
MRVDGIIFADEDIIEHAVNEKTLDQVINVATLPGIVGASLAMPDIHYGYGFPIGGVAAMDCGDGVISPGGVGFDISCGVRLYRTGLFYDDIKQHIRELMSLLSAAVPKGVGSSGKIKLSDSKIKDVLTKGAKWAISNGYGMDQEQEYLEENGFMEEADPGQVSPRAYRRGSDQLGTLGSGNHFLEIQKVEKIYNQQAAGVFGIEPGQITVMIHSGSRGLGHQVCSDFLKVMGQASARYGIHLADRQLACAPIDSPEGRSYYGAMAAAVNYALANRQCLGHWVVQTLQQYFKKSADKLGINLIYDVSHNIAKMEDHYYEGRKLKLCVHRKGATRSLGPNSSHIPAAYRSLGQPVIIPGDMGRYSYVLTGTNKSEQESFSSTCHGAGRLMSRTRAKKTVRGQEVKDYLLQKHGVVAIADSMASLAEEAPLAYKDVKNVVDITQKAGLSDKVARLKPLGVLKG